MRLPPICRTGPQPLVAGIAALGCTVLLLAHPGWYQQRAAYPAVVAGLGLAVAVALASRRPRWRDVRLPGGLAWGCGLLAAGAGVSVAANGAAWAPLWQVVAQLLLLWVGWWLAADPRAVRLWLLVLLAGGGTAGAYAVLQYLGLDPQPAATRFTERIPSSFDNPNHFANYMALLLPVGLAGYLRQDRGGREFWARYGLVGLLYAGLVMAASRSAWAAAASGGLLVLALHAHGVRRGLCAWRPRSMVLLAVLLLAITQLLALRPVFHGPGGPVTLGQRALSSANIVGPGAQLDSTVRHRYFLWKVTWDMIRTRPLAGLGYGSYSSRFAAFREARRNDESFQRLSWEQRNEVTPYAHNEYLHLWAEAGLLGLGGFALLVVAAVGTGLRTGLTIGRRDPALLGLVGLAVAMLVDGLASYPLHLPLNGLVFWLSLGIISNSDLVSEHGVPQPGHPVIHS